MKYIKFTRSQGVNIFLTVVLGLIALYALAYALGYLAGALTAFFE